MIMEKTFTATMYSDPSHAWAKVKRQVLVNLGLDKLVSANSYQYKDNVYLEEDVDLSLLYERLLKDDVRMRFNEKHTENPSRIRSYDSYQP
jgi:hypothetical protein